MAICMVCDHIAMLMQSQRRAQLMDHNLITPGGAIIVDNSLMKVPRSRPPGCASCSGVPNNGQQRVSSMCVDAVVSRPVRAARRAAEDHVSCAGRAARTSPAA